MLFCLSVTELDLDFLYIAYLLMLVCNANAWLSHLLMKNNFVFMSNCIWPSEKPVKYLLLVNTGT